MRRRYVILAFLAALVLSTLVGCGISVTPPNNNGDTSNSNNSDGTADTASYSGIIQNGVGADPIAGAAVYLELTDSMTGDGYVYVPPAARSAAGIRQNGLQSTTSGSDGSFAFDDLPPGSYQITVEPPATRDGMIRLAGVKVDLEAGDNTQATLPLVTSDDLDGAEVRVTPEQATMEAGGEQTFTVILVRRDGSEIQAFYPVWSLSRPVGSLEFPPNGSCIYHAPDSVDPTTLTVNASIGDPSESSAFISGSARVEIAGGSSSDDVVTGSIGTDSSVSGTISTPGETHSYTWAAQPGTYVIEIDVFDGLDSILEVSQGGNQIDWNDDGGFGLGSRLEFTVPSSSAYTLTVRGYGDTLTGSYDLSVTSLGGSAGSDTLEAGQTATGAVSASGQSTSYGWQASPGVYAVEVSVADGLDSIVELWQDGIMLDSNDDGGVGLGALLEVTVTTDTLYNIVVRGYGGSSTGSYTLSVTETASGGQGEVIATAEDTLASGDEHVYDWVTLPGTYILETTVADGLDTVLDIKRDGTVIQSNDDGGVGYASRIQITITDSETLQVVVRGYGGASSGSYTMTITRLLTSANGELVEMWTGDLQPGAIDVYTWNAAPGVYVVETATTAVDTVLELVQGGTTIDRDDDGGVGSASRLDVTVTSSDTYELWVSGYSATEAGAYELSVTRMGDAAAAARSAALESADKSTTKYLDY